MSRCLDVWHRVNYGRAMTTSIESRWLGRRGVASTWALSRALSAALALAGVAPMPAPVLAAEPGLLERCFAPSALAAREGEATPVKGAAGHAQRIPQSAAPQSASTTEPVPTHLRGVVRRVALPPGKKLIALTLDLCEQPGEISGYDGAIFDYLRANRIKATIFTGGKWLMTHPERSRQLIADARFELGSHGWAHRNVRALSGSDLIQEIRGPEAAFQVQRSALAAHQCVAAIPNAMTALQQRLALYRFPFGACSPASLDTLASNGMLAIQWDLSTGDSSKSHGAEAIARDLIANTRPGSIILAHANGRGHHTAAALPIAIPALRAKGFTFVTVSELLAAGKPVIVDTCYDARPGDTDKYDALFAPRRPTTEPTHGRATTPSLSR